MHLMSPVYTTTGKKKGKKKFRNAEAAAKAKRNADAWQQLLEKYDIKPQKKSKRSIQPVTKLDPVVHSTFVYDSKRDTSNIPSVDTGKGVAAKKEVIHYTGDAMIGIGVLHKSNSVPIFKQEDAEAISKMRRG